jgi:hypothetical protein
MEEVFRERVPWLDESLFLVGASNGNKVNLVLIRRTGGIPSYDNEVHKVCDFSGGNIVFDKKQVWPPGVPLTDAERLCFSVMPKDFNPVRMPTILADPYWQWIIDHMRAAFVMTS